ncbi:MAG: VCBS repeat-containing protein [Deltaproteobacteria bacterium]|nr:VCBS repeat-containing protein [Nannocystaceae bacterium]
MLDECQDNPELSSYCVPRTPAFVTVRDADGDGDADVFVLSRSGFITAATNGGHGRFSPTFFRTGISPAQASDSLLLCDVDDDGRLDLVHDGSRVLDGATAWLQPVGDTEWVLQRIIQTRLSGATCIDVDGDGRQEVVGLRAADLAGALPGTSPTFDEVVERAVDLPAARVPPQFVGFADVSDDTVPDLLAMSDDGTTLFVLSGSAMLAEYAARTEHQVPLTGTTSMRLIDVDDDGIPDVALGGFSGDVPTLVVLLSRPDAGTVDFDVLEPIELAVAPDTLEPADVDGDGFPELVVGALPSAGLFAVDAIDGTLAEIVLDDLVVAIGAADFDGDAFADLVVLPSQRDQMQILWNDGAGNIASGPTR